MRDHLPIRVIAALACLALILCYAPILHGMADQWRTDEDMGHGFAVPFVIAWIVWRERARWRGLAAAPTAWGLAVLAIGAAFHVMSAVGAGLFAGSLGLVFSILGLVLVIGGFPYLRVWAFPFLLAVFMLPKLAVVYNMSTLPLQLAATRLAEGMLTLGGIAVTREGNILGAGALRVAVVEACNGIRYLLPLGFLGVIFAYLTDPKPWMRAAMLVAAVPLAILANAWRVGLTVVAEIRHPKLAEEPYHALLGVLIFVLCLGGMRVIQWGIDKVYERAHS